jgi:glycosyltransferase involved in cell wall biosynthesis
MIVRDEERVLRRALNSVKGLADEMVVVDTGSKDNTVAIAREMGAKTAFFQWNDHFADARNYSMDQATGDWILILDADEEFYAPDREKLLRLIENPAIDSIALVLRNLFPCPETQTNQSLPNISQYRHTANHLPRLLRNKPEIRYHRRIHEDIPPSAIPPERRYISDISIYHYGYCYQDDRKERRAERNQRLTGQFLSENPTDPTAHFYVGSTNLAAGRIEEADECFRKVLEHAPRENDTYIHFRVMALFHLARNAAQREDYATEEKYSVEAILIEPEYLDAWLRVGEAFFHLEKYWMAERAFHRYRSLLANHRKNTPRTRYTLYQLGMEHMACYYLGRLAEFRFDWERARKHYVQAIEFDPQRGCLAHFYLANIYARERNYHKMDVHLAKARQLAPKEVEKLLKSDLRLPAADKSDLGGSPAREANSRPDPTAAYALSLGSRPALPQGKLQAETPKPEAKPLPAPQPSSIAPSPSSSPIPPSSINHQPSLPPVCWSGAFLESGDWAENSRSLLNAAQQSLDIYVELAGQADPGLPLSPEGVQRIRGLADRGAPGDRNYVRLWDMPPSRIEKPDPAARWNVARLDWPTDRLPEGWQEKCRHFDQIWVPSLHHRKMLTDSGIPSERIRVLPGAIDTEAFSPDRDVQPLPLDCLDKFNFLSVFDWDDTAAWQTLLKAYLTTFKPDEPVNLILKPEASPGANTTQIEMNIVHYLNQQGINLVQSPSIVFLAHRLPPEHKAMLYRAGDAFVLLGHGGAASPHYLEAMAMGLPIVATRWGAHLDYLNDSNAFLVNLVHFGKAEWRDFTGHRWAVPSEEHLKEVLRKIFSEPDKARAIGRRAREVAVRELGLRAAIGRMVANLRELSAAGTPA